MEFNCRELVYAIIEYDARDFEGVDISVDKAEWEEKFDSESMAVLVGDSLLQVEGLENLSMEADSDQPSSEKVYVVVYHFYENSEYELSADLDGDVSAIQVSLLASMKDGDEPFFGNIVEYFRVNEEEIFPECLSSDGATETRVAIFKGSTLIRDDALDEIE